MMACESDNRDWEKFLGRPRITADEGRLRAAHAGRTILLTGAGGSIGSALGMKLAALAVRRLILLENCEQNLYQIDRDLKGLANAAPHISILGDIADRTLLDDLFNRHRPEIIYHAAAFKHVPLMEANPVAAIRNNALGTCELAQAAAHHAARLVMISTDKAVNPHSVMGVSKRLAELALMAASSHETPMHSIRLGNVLGSQGSVVQLFRRQIRQGGPVTVTHPDVRRYFLTLGETVKLVLLGASLASPPGVWIPQPGQHLKILDLAEHLIRAAGLEPGKDVPITFIGLRPGDKLTEQLVSTRESLEGGSVGGLRRVSGPRWSQGELESAMEELTEMVRRRDVPALTDALCRIVPEYQPSAALLAEAGIPQIRVKQA